MGDAKDEKKERKESNKDAVKYFSLSPRDDLDKEKSTKENYEHYEEKLKWALDKAREENIKNIAITGYYGSGKSSILKTFIKNHHTEKPNKNEYKFLELSLATFHDDKEGGEKVKDIEKSLLQQIFYKVEDDKIPNSRLKKISNGVNFNFFEQGLLTAIVLITFIRLYNLIFGIQPFFGFYWLDIILGVATLFLLLLKIKVINKISFKRLKYKSLEVEIEKNNNELSILSRFLDEIIYFFKETKYNVVVIEDIDRFESTEIFSNLRELNLILNNTELIKKRIVFIYAIKNEQFKTANDRTKFFDFIIPIIPVVNYETAPNLFIKNFAEIGDEQMIRDLFALVDDARVIYNTLNELKTYLAILGQSNYSEIQKDLYNKLIPLVYYKNVEPFDFSGLLKRKGYLYSILQKEEIIKSDKKGSITNQIKKIQDEIKTIQRDSFKGYNEIKRFILSGIFTYASKNFNITYNNLQIKNDVGEYEKNILDIEKLDDFDKILFEDKIEFRNAYNSPQYIRRSDIEKLLNINIVERLNLLRDSNKIKEKDERILRLQDDIPKIDKKSLKDLIKEEYLDLHLNKFEETAKSEIDSESKIENKPNFEIIKTLIVNGYIDSAYFLYLSNHSDLELNFDDHKFWLGLKNNINIGFHHKLSKPDKISQKLVTSDYTSSAILNFDFINYCFKNRSKTRANQRLLIIEQLSKLETLEIEFLISYFERCDNVGLFIKLLCQKSGFLWQKISEDDRFKDDLKNKYFEAILQYADVNDIYKFSQNSNFTDYIYKHPDIISLINNTVRTKEIIERLQLILDNINFDTDRKQVLDFIYNNNCYTISLENISGFYKYKLGKFDESLHEKILTHILNHKDDLESMYNYINSEKRLETFVKNLIIDVPTNTKESKDVLIGLLNRSKNELSTELKSKLIKHENIIFPDVSEIDEEEIKIELLKNNKLDPNLENIIQIWNDNSGKEKVDAEIQKQKLSDKEDAIAQFLNQNVKSLLEEDDEDFQAQLNTIIGKIILLDKIDNQILEEIIKNFKFSHNFNDQLKNLNREKINLLIDNGYFDFNDENIDSLKSNYSLGIAIRFIEAESSKDMSKIDELNLDDDIMLSLLNTKNAELKKHLSKYYLDKVQKKLIQSKTSIISKIAKFCINSRWFLDAKQSYVLKDSKLDVSNSVKLLNEIIETLSENEIRIYLSNMDNNKFKEIADESSRPNIPNDSNNLVLVERLKKRGIISSYKEKNHKIQVFKHKKS